MVVNGSLWAGDNVTQWLLSGHKGRFHWREFKTHPPLCSQPLEHGWTAAGGRYELILQVTCWHIPLVKSPRPTSALKEQGYDQNGLKGRRQAITLPLTSRLFLLAQEWLPTGFDPDHGFRWSSSLRLCSSFVLSTCWMFSWAPHKRHVVAEAENPLPAGVAGHAMSLSHGHQLLLCWTRQ